MAENLKLASCGDNIKIWSGIDMQLLYSYNPHSNDNIAGISWGHNNQVMCSITAESTKVVVSSTKSAPVKLIELEAEGRITCAAFNSNSRYVVVGSRTPVVSVFDLKSRNIQKVFESHTDTVTCVSFSNRDQYIASGAANGHIRIDNVITSQSGSPLIAEGCQAIRALQYSRFRSALLGTTCDSGALNLWDTNTMKLWWSTHDAHFAPATDISFSTVNDMLLATVGLDKRILLSDVRTKKVVKVIDVDSPLSAITFNADGATLAVGSTRGKIMIFDLRTGSSPIRSVNGHTTPINGLSFQNLITKDSHSTRHVKQAHIHKAPTVQQPAKTSTPAVNSAIVSKIANGVSDTISFGNTGRSDVFSPVREILGGTAESLIVESSQANRLQTSGAGIFSPVSTNTETTPASLNDRDSILDYKTTIENKTIRQGRSLQDIKRRYEEIQRNADLVRSSVVDLKVSADNQDSSRKPRSSSCSSSDDVGPEVTRKTVTVLASPLTRSASSGILSQIASSNEFTPEDNGAMSNMDSASANIPIAYSQSIASLSDNTTTLVDKPDFNKSPPQISASSNVNHDESSLQFGIASQQGLTEHVQISPGIAVTLDDKPNLTKSPPQTVAASNANYNELVRPFQVQFIKNMIDESIDELRESLHKDIVNIQFEMLRQFQIQLNEMKRYVKEASVTEELLAEIERLRIENEKLKCKH